MSMDSPDIEYQHTPPMNKLTLSQYFERELLEESSASERNRNDSDIIYNGLEKDGNEHEHEGEEVEEEEEEEIDIYTSYASYMSSSDPGSDNILVTIDYGSMEEDGLSIDSLGILEEEVEENVKNMDLLQVPPRFTRMTKIKEERSTDSLQKSSESLRKSLNPFQVHRMQHSDTRSSSAISLMNSLIEYNVDTSGDYGSWQQQSESEDGDTENRCEYRYEDLIKGEIINDDNDDDDDDAAHADVYQGDEDNGEDFGEARRHNDYDDDDDLVDFNYDVALSARWSSDNDKMYYRSVDYLN